MIAIISDIHANKEALEAVLKHIKSQKVEKIYCLGDIIGYGPDPVDCLNYAREWEVNLCGNHELATTTTTFGFNRIAKNSIEWTRNILKPKWLEFGKKSLWKFIKKLPYRYEKDEFLFVHASPRDPIGEYVLEEYCDDAIGGTYDGFEEMFKKVKKVCFIGHTHKPGILTDDYNFIHIEDIDYKFKIPSKGKYIINIGSVGQPRDGDRRACYVTTDGQTVWFHRIEYDCQRTIEKIKNIPEIDNRLAERLKNGI